jgi:hypothetical protein
MIEAFVHDDIGKTYLATWALLSRPQTENFTDILKELLISPRHRCH